MNFLGILICKWKGHKRGIRHTSQSSSYPSSWTYDAAMIAYAKGLHIYMCPRCYATWTRKAKVVV